MQIQGLIFDFNGVLVDDESLHFEAFQEALKEEGLDLRSEEYYEKYLAYDDRNMVVNFLTDRGRQTIDGRIQELIELKSSHYRKAIEENVPAIDASVNFVRRLPPEVPLAIASGAARAEIELILMRLGLANRFSAIVAAEDVENGKPHPEAFLKAFEGLRQQQPQLLAEKVVVIEDSYRGVQSVRAANLKCVALATSYPPERLAEADLVLESLDGLTLHELQERL